jgi:hypothetical protein
MPAKWKFMRVEAHNKKVGRKGSSKRFGRKELRVTGTVTPHDQTAAAAARCEEGMPKAEAL